ncbi:formylglycine-generating enzyme family protein [Sesbania bispinosa]|nr:formylglycine-generating enzyme family protein [Sesbania bispinosa]
MTVIVDQISALAALITLKITDAGKKLFRDHHKDPVLHTVASLPEMMDYAQLIDKNLVTDKEWESWGGQRGGCI